MAMTNEEERIFEQGKKRRETKEKIREESKAGKYEGGGLGEAQGRKMAAMVTKEDQEDAAEYGGMDMASKEQQRKAYGGKVNKMAKGGKVKKSSTSRGDGIAQRGKTKGRMV